MSAALETPAGSSLSLAPTTPVSRVPLSGTNEWNIDVHFVFDNNLQQWVVSPSVETVALPFDTLDQITWNLIPPAGIDPSTLFFLTPPLSFPQLQVQAPMVVISNMQSTPQQCVAVWANVDTTKTGTYSYTLNIEIAGQTVTHDPTVENESPTG